MGWWLLGFAVAHPLLAMLFWAWARTRWRVFGVLGLPLDALLNATTCWVLWGRPREWTISQRLKRRQNRLQSLADALAAWLNRHDPGHV